MESELVSSEEGHQSVHQELLPQHRTLNVKKKCCHKVRRIESKGTVLVILWTFLMSLSIINPVYNNTIYTADIEKDDLYSAFFMVTSSVIILTAPVAGLLASICCGRYKAVVAGLWLTWIGNVIVLSMYILQWFLPDIHQTLSYTGFLIGAGLSCMGLALYMTNSLPFGVDQMPFASGEQIGAFIHWYVWSILVGMLVNTVGRTVAEYITLQNSGGDIMKALLSLVLLSVGMSTSFLLRGWLTIEPQGKNPIATICGVLTFAASHKYPVRRSAFTYCELEKPSRMDYCKSKYGGPYSNEEVEDVKTCLRMTLVVASLGLVELSVSLFIFSLYKALHTEFISTINRYGDIVTASYVVPTALGTAGYELLIYPLIKKWSPTTLRRIGYTQALTICMCLLMLVSSTVWYMYNSPSHCMFASSGSSQFSVDRNWMDVPIRMLLSISIFFIVTAIAEFVCAQAPYILRGLLVGLMWSVSLFSFALGGCILLLWNDIYQQKGTTSPSCGIWFYLFTTISAVFGLILWCAVAQWYKRRERDEPELCRMFAENYYSH